MADTFLHEIGHTIGLQHAKTPFSEYGDNSSPMGSLPGIRCYNAPQSWREFDPFKKKYLQPCRYNRNLIFLLLSYHTSFHRAWLVSSSCNTRSFDLAPWISNQLLPPPSHRL